MQQHTISSTDVVVESAADDPAQPVSDILKREDKPALASTAEPEINNTTFSSPVIVDLSPSPSPIVADSCSADEWSEALLDGTGSIAHYLNSCHIESESLSASTAIATSTPAKPKYADLYLLFRDLIDHQSGGPW